MTNFYNKIFITSLALFLSFGFFGVAYAQTIDVDFQSDPLFPGTASPLAPGDSVSSTFTVTNTNAQAETVYIRTLNDSDTNSLADALLVSIRDENGLELYGDQLSDLFSRDNKSDSPPLESILSNQSRTYDFIVTFAPQAGNTYQDGTATFDFCVGFAGGDENCITGTGTGTGGGGGGGGGGSGGGGDDSDNPDDDNDPPPGQVAGVSTDAPFWNDLINRFIDLGKGGLDSLREAVLGTEDVNAQEEVATSTDDGTAFDSEETGVGFIDGIDWCKYWWLLLFLWIISSIVAYLYRRRNVESLALVSVQVVFGVIALVLLVLSFILDIACAFWPALIVTVGAITTYFWSLG
ncbi:MAG: hypothetical protein WD605_00760 [Candidatus Paceibacterota bacterium]